MHSLVARYATGNDEAELIRRHASIIERCARSIATKSGGLTSVEDLWSAGALGLVEAARRFDAGRGVKLETFLERRVRGAMLDELRRADHLPRRLRQRVSELKTTRQRLLASFGREPERAELASALGVDIEEVEAIEGVLEPPMSFGPEHENVLSDEGEPVELDAGLEVGALLEAIDALPERLRVLLSLRYVEGMTLREIASVLDVSEPRVSQLHQGALAKLRAVMQMEGLGG